MEFYHVRISDENLMTRNLTRYLNNTYNMYNKYVID